MKEWKYTCQLFFDTSKHDSTIVRANSERKALIFGKEYMMKKYNTKMITDQHVELIKEEED